MSNPYREVYDAMLAVMRADVALASRLAFIPIRDINSVGTSRRRLDEGGALKVALVPLGGVLENISSSTSRATEQYALKSIAGSISLDDILELKWLLLTAFWNNRDLNLSYVENVDVISVTDESNIGTGAVDTGAGPSLTWQVTLIIKVKFLLNRTTLPMS